IPDRTKYAQGSAMPFPHRRYSALSECGSFSHLRICFSVLDFFVPVPTFRCGSNTSARKRIYSSVRSSVPRSEHHHSRKHWSLGLLRPGDNLSVCLNRICPDTDLLIGRILRSKVGTPPVRTALEPCALGRGQAADNIIGLRDDRHFMVAA